MSEHRIRTVVSTAIAMLAFAANSLLCRFALGQSLVDAASFTSIRVVSGAVVLGLIMIPRWPRRSFGALDWRAAALLFTYMACFSFAYLSLAAGTGALLLFGTVQLTMLVAALWGGERFSALAWTGFVAALLGLIILVSPGLAAPSPGGALLMAVAGVAWGGYSLRGRRSADPLAATTASFLSSVPAAILLSLIFGGDFHVSAAGFALAVGSGALASGIGYVIWYTAIAGLSAGRAAVVQLSVPVIAAFGGVLLLSEAITLRLLVASGATLGGIALVLAARRSPMSGNGDSGTAGITHR